jgi:hypothetical protein
MKIFNRKDWAAREPKCETKLATPVDVVYIHHTADNLSWGGVGAECDYLLRIQRTHMDDPDRDYCDIAYNYVVFPSGRTYRGRGGRTVGAATEGHNSSSISVCFAGNFELQQPTAAALQSAHLLLRHLRLRRRTIWRPTIRGHRDVNATACPGRYLYERLAAIR